MSYDISIETKDDDGVDIEAWCANITYNLSAMLKASGLRFGDLDGMTARDAHPHLVRSFQWLSMHPVSAKALEPENGWGTYEGLLVYVFAFKLACLLDPDGIVRVY